MREKLIELLEQAKYCTTEELADYLIAAGLKLPVRCENCTAYRPGGYIRNDAGWCKVLAMSVRCNNYCHLWEERKE